MLNKIHLNPQNVPTRDERRQKEEKFHADENDEQADLKAIFSGRQIGRGTTQNDDQRSENQRLQNQDEDFVGEDARQSSDDSGTRVEPSRQIRPERKTYS